MQKSSGIYKSIDLDSTTFMCTIAMLLSSISLSQNCLKTYLMSIFALFGKIPCIKIDIFEEFSPSAPRFRKKTTVNL